jgi:vancomycin resistance protein YoaR
VTDDADGGLQKVKRLGGALPKWLLIGGPIAIVILVGAYVGLATFQSGKIQRGTTVSGHAVGGLSSSDAKAEVTAAAAKQLKTPITLVADGKTLTLQPASAGLSFDTTHALDGLSGFSLNPATVWHRLFGHGPSRTPTPKVDQKTLQLAVTNATGSLKGAPKNGTVKFLGGKVVTIRSTPGKGVDYEAVAKQIGSHWPQTKRYTATISERPAALTDTEIQRYVKEFATPAMSGSVTVRVGGKTTKLDVADVSDILSTKFDGAKLQPKVDEKALEKLLDEQASGLTTPAVNAKLHLQGGKSSIVAGQDGTAPVTKDAGKSLLAALTAPKRTMTLKTTTVKPTVTAADLKKTTVGSHLISEFVSPFPTGAENAARTHNIAVGLARINGLVVQPGETFSLLNTLRPFDAAHGYVDAPTLQGGIDVPGMGGGISQVSTTLYNATFFAGVKEVEHTAHAFWIPRYPMGREATMWDPTIDNKWQNDTGHPIRMWAGVEGNAAVIRLYGVKTFTVSSTTSGKFDIVKPGPTKHLKGDKCIAQEPEDGFSVTVTRVVKDSSGKVVKNESSTTKYIAAVRVTCD